MCEMLVWSFDAMAGLPWLEIVKAIAPVVTAVIAFLALRNWKRQDKAKRQADFLDELLEAVHGYINLLSKPVDMTEFVKIGMESHQETWLGGDQRIKGAINYINKRGAEDSKRLVEALNACRELHVRLQSLSAKGQVFKFEDYRLCKNGLDAIAAQFTQLQWLAWIISSPTTNWENPEVLQFLEKMIAIRPDDIRKQVDANSLVILTFVTTTYARIYGK